MTARILEAVPNFSEGRNLAILEDIVAAVRAAGAEVLDASADADHHRSVVTFIGPPAAVEDAAFESARVAVERIDLRAHSGVHPRIGAVDVLPFVPLAGLGLEEARASARRVGRRLAEELGVPVFFYGEASEPPGRALAELRQGGFEGIAAGWPADRRPDLLPPGWSHAGAHPSAGATCVGARPLLLAWNVYVDGLSRAAVAEVVAAIRERGGGFRGLRALGFELPAAGAMQISMNLENVGASSPLEVFARIEAEVESRGGRIRETEVIGMLPDELVLSAAAERLRLRGPAADRLLSRRLAEYLAGPAAPSQRNTE